VDWSLVRLIDRREIAVVVVGFDRLDSVGIVFQLRDKRGAVEQRSVIYANVSFELIRILQMKLAQGGRQNRDVARAEAVADYYAARFDGRSFLAGQTRRQLFVGLLDRAFLEEFARVNVDLSRSAARCTADRRRWLFAPVNAGE
jgi:hypothetical protein